MLEINEYQLLEWKKEVLQNRGVRKKPLQKDKSLLSYFKQLK